MEMNFFVDFSDTAKAWTLRVHRCAIIDETTQDREIISHRSAEIQGSLSEFIRYAAKADYGAEGFSARINVQVEKFAALAFEAAEIQQALKVAQAKTPTLAVKLALNSLCGTSELNAFTYGLRAMLENRDVWRRNISDGLLDRCEALVNSL